MESHVAEMMSIREAERQLKQELLKSQELLRMEQLKTQRLSAQVRTVNSLAPNSRDVINKILILDF